MERHRQRANMVEHQLRRRGIADSRVLAAMNEVPREAFVPTQRHKDAYADGALPLGHGQTISQPLMVAMSVEALGLRGEETVLEIGAGSGYQAAVLSRVAKQVHAVEIVPELADRAASALAALGITNVEIHESDGREGWPSAAPYDGIVVAAASEDVPDALLEQLSGDGTLVIPLGEPDTQTLTAITSKDGRLVREELCRCVFVPLVHGG
ncbi:MAG: protein-L-isoaspartate(D-aspartate) O-methyltransferase [Myxococcota bacterium]